MKDERLEHIRDSVEFQLEVAEHLKIDKEVILEEKELLDEIDRLKNINKKTTDKIQYIIDYGFDYDGLNTVESLKGLIDMLVDYAVQSRNILDGKDE